MTTHVALTGGSTVTEQFTVPVLPAAVGHRHRVVEGAADRRRPADRAAAGDASARQADPSP